jgi:hypothetical protein
MARAVCPWCTRYPGLFRAVNLTHSQVLLYGHYGAVTSEPFAVS